MTIFANPLPPDDPIVQRLEEQLHWYDSKSGQSKRKFRLIKITEIIAAALIPFLSGKIPEWRAATFSVGALGVLVTVLEGVLQLNQYQQDWTTYRATAEALKHEKYLFLAGAGAYASAVDVRAVLAERVESLVSQENSKWMVAQQQAAQQQIRLLNEGDASGGRTRPPMS